VKKKTENKKQEDEYLKSLIKKSISHWAIIMHTELSVRLSSVTRIYKNKLIKACKTQSYHMK